MLRKTAVIAVLILLLSSFTLGSTGRIQTVATAGNEGDVLAQSTEGRDPATFTTMAGVFPGGHTHNIAVKAGAGTVTNDQGTEEAARHAAGFFSVTRMYKTPDTIISEGYFQGALVTAVAVDGAPEAGFAPVVVINGDCVSAGPGTARSVDEGPDASYFPGGTVSIASGSDMSGTGMSIYGMQGTGFITFLTNESRLEIAGPPTTQFYVNNDMFDGRLKSMLRDMRSRMTDAWVARYLHTPVILSGPDGVQSQRFDMRMEGRPVLSGVPGEFNNFTGKLVIPWGESGVVYGPDGPLPVNNGAIEIDSSMLVDMANVTFANATAAKTAVYNNEISGGQTNWHKVDISDAVESFNVDLKWQNINDSLRLLLYSPDGKILGPYYDDSDGKTDGRINLNIAHPSGVASGEWQLKVTDMSTLGTDDYYVKTY
jgi:hypothetical protein